MSNLSHAIMVVLLSMPFVGAMGMVVCWARGGSWSFVVLGAVVAFCAVMNVRQYRRIRSRQWLVMALTRSCRIGARSALRSPRTAPEG